MPKLFPINLEVEELAVGRVMRQLHNMPGVAKVSLDMGAPKKPNGDARGLRGPYKPRKTFETSGTDEVAKLLYKKQMSTPQLSEAFAAMGRSPASTSSILHELKNDQLIKRSEDGEGWVLTKKMRDRMRHHQK